VFYRRRSTTLVTFDHAKYFEVTMEVEDKKLHMATWCILALDQALY
jgi:hypothetical protein